MFSSSPSSEEALQNPKCPKRAKRYTLRKRPPAAPEVFGAVLETFLLVLRCSTAAQVFSAEGLQNLSKGTPGGWESWDSWDSCKSWELGASVAGLTGCMRFQVVSRNGAGGTDVAWKHPKFRSQQAPGPAMLLRSLPSALPC